MAKFLIGLVTGVILAILMAVILVFALMRAGAERRPAVADGSTLMLKLEGEIPERPPVEFPIPFLERQTPLTVRDTWDLLRKAAADSRVKAVLFEPQSLNIGWAKMQEIRAGLERFRKSGKPLIAYLRTPGTREYYLATAAERVYMAPQDMLDLKGLRVEMMYFQNTLEKIGVGVQIEHAGKYKDFGDTFTRESMSPETREVMNSVLDELYGNLLQRISEARRKPVEEVRAIIDQGPFLSGQALKAGLVDGLVFEDQVVDELKKRLKQSEIKRLSHRSYARVSPASVGLEGKQRIALVVGEGSIARGEEGDDGLSDQGIGSGGFTRLLRRAAEDKSIKGVVVRIDSPGGEVYASDEIWREMNLLSRRKPLVISMSDAAASGGYYIAMTGDPIVAYPGTITGSIGVVFGKATLRGLYDKLGITKDMLTRGRFAAIDSDYRPLSETERAKVNQGVQATYADFIAKVAKARRRPPEEIETLAQGRVWLGSQARRNGLVDEVGGLDRAIELVKQKARIPEREQVTLVSFPPRRTIFDVAFGHPAQSVWEARIPKVLRSWEARMWLKGGLMRLMPYAIEVR
ncbi:MAG: signal peptide peptidase SppA [Bryobacterales bacterium]|nr:signal peptide peptidase SppA [Bryobacterales bacterium]